MNAGNLDAYTTTSILMQLENASRDEKSASVIDNLSTLIADAGNKKRAGHFCPALLLTLISSLWNKRRVGVLCQLERHLWEPTACAGINDAPFRIDCRAARSKPACAFAI
jgi:hypothetical protein